MVPETGADRWSQARKAGEESTPHPGKEACVEESPLPCHFNLPPPSKAAKITQLCPTPAQASPPSVMGAPPATTGPGRRGVMLITTSSLCRQILRP